MNDLEYVNILLILILFFVIYTGKYIMINSKKVVVVNIILLLFFLIAITSFNFLVDGFFIFCTLLLLVCLIDPIKNYLKSPKDKVKKKRLIKNTVIVPYYNPPTNIHPAIAGFLIDKRIGKREYFATIFHAIIDGILAIDEQIVSGKYKYYLIKNKGYKKSISCDRLVANYIFFQVQDKKFSDSVSFEEIKINSGVLSEFINNELVKLKYFEDPYYISQKSIDNLKWIEEKENNLFKSNPQNNSVSSKKRKPIKTLKREYFLNKYRYTDFGIQERAKWLGFKDYLQTAERFRLDEEKVETFSKYLPYAIALGVETQWAKRFENMNVDRLKWFRSQKSESIKRHDNQKVYFKHLLKFLGQIYVK